MASKRGGQHDFAFEQVVSRITRGHGDQILRPQRDSDSAQGALRRMTAAPMEEWLDRLGYAAEPRSLHIADAVPSYAHPYALEIQALLKPDGAVRAHAVFDVEGVPTVVFLDTRQRVSAHALAEARKRIWNQNLATIVIDVQGDQALAWPARKLQSGGERIELNYARPDGPFSAFDVVSANLLAGCLLGSTSRNAWTESSSPIFPPP